MDLAERALRAPDRRVEVALRVQHRAARGRQQVVARVPKQARAQTGLAEVGDAVGARDGEEVVGLQPGVAELGRRPDPHGEMVEAKAESWLEEVLPLAGAVEVVGPGRDGLVPEPEEPD